jgi:hypothetical protein
MEGNEERHWLIILACPCPVCNYPSVHTLMPAFEPSNQSINETQMPIVECGRCEEQFRPQVHGCYRQIVPWSLKTGWQRRIADR